MSGKYPTANQSPYSGLRGSQPRSWTPVSPSPPPIISAIRRPSPSAFSNAMNPRPQWPQQYSAESTYYNPNRSRQTYASNFSPLATGRKSFQAVPSNQIYKAPTSSFQLSPTPSPAPFAYKQEHQQPYLRQQMAASSSSPLNYQLDNPYDYNTKGIQMQTPPDPRSCIIYDYEEHDGPSTAEIIANQSQDYIDEKLAEYQLTILQLQGK